MANRKEAIERLNRVIDQQERKISDAFLESLEALRTTAEINVIADALELMDTNAVMALFSAGITDDAFQKLQAAIGDAVIAGGQTAAEIQPPITGPRGTKVNFVFNATNPKLSQFARDVSATRIREVSDDVRRVVRDVVQEEVVAGRNPRDSARRIRESVGLTRRQEQSVRNFRRNLELAAEGNESAMNEAQARELRDKRFKIRQGMTQKQIDKQVERYRQNYINYRARVIGRTESIRAINGSSKKLIESYVEDGRVDERQVRRFWHYTRDSRTRPEHRLIPAMNENGVGLNEPFETPLGPLMYPGDPSGSAGNVIQCRCTVFNRVISMELIADET